MAFSFRARFVFPVDLPPIEGGVVVVEGERIVSVGRTAEGEITDLGDVALFPAFVNAHTHLEFSHLQRPLGQPGMRLVDWIRIVIAEKKRHQNGPAPVVESGIKESLSFGVTTIGDIATCDVAAHLLPECDLTSFVEVIGFSRARASSIIGGVVARLVPQNWTEWEFKRPIARIHAGLSPHAPYTVSLHLLRVLIGLARDDNIPLAMHLAESREELHFLTDGTGPFRELLEERSMWDETAVPRGSRPLDYLRMLAESPRTLVIHGNYLNYEELRFLGANRDRMSLVYCPRTHSYFDHEAYPLDAARAMRVRVALGTDSRASNPDLSILAEMRQVFRVVPDIDPMQVLRMGTLSAAKALGRDKDVGSISPGKQANLVTVPIASDTRGTPKDVLAAILADDSQPNLTCAAGHRRLHP